MNQDEFERLNYLSEKVLYDTASTDEVIEFSHLLNDWNESVELNIIRDLQKNGY